MIFVVSLLCSSCAAMTLQSQDPCNAKTKIFMPAAENAAGEMQYIVKEGWTSETCFSIGRSDVKTVKICGPGEFSFSAMSCKRHDYKAVVHTESKSENTGECMVQDLMLRRLINCLVNLGSLRSQGYIGGTVEWRSH